MKTHARKRYQRFTFPLAVKPLARSLSFSLALALVLALALALAPTLLIPSMFENSCVLFVRAQAEVNKLSLSLTVRDMRGLDHDGDCPAWDVDDPCSNTLMSGHPHFDLDGDGDGAGNEPQYTEGTSSDDAVDHTCGYGDSNCFDHTIGPMVQNELVLHRSGLLKPVYCHEDDRDSNGFCGKELSGSPGISSLGVNENHQKEAFDAWFHDSWSDTEDTSSDEYLYRNLRSAWTIELEDLGDGRFQFDSLEDGADEDESPFIPFTKEDLDLELGERSKTAFDALGEGNGVCPSGGVTCEFNEPLNYLFTTEWQGFFTYRQGDEFEFSGDDDVWVFINGTLRVDIGGLHPQMRNRVLLDEIDPPLQEGEVYPISMFHAERKCCGSNFRVTTTLTAPCSAATAGTTELDFPNSNDTKSGLFVLGGSNYGIINEQDEILLTDGNTPHSVGYAFFERAINIGGGFVTEFTFTASKGSEGIAFILQRSGLLNMNGGTGGNIGVRNMRGALAVVFDFCPERPNSCETQEIRIHSNGLGKNNAAASTRFEWDNLHGGADCADEQPVTVRIQSLVNPPWLEVYVNGSLYLVNRDFDVETFLGGRDAYMGFTSSNGDDDRSGTTKITSWRLDSVPIRNEDTKLLTSTDAPQEVLADERERARFVIRNTDACGSQVTFGGFSERVKAEFYRTGGGVDDANADGDDGDGDDTAESNQAGATDANTDTIVEGIVTDNQNGTYTIELETSIVGEWSLNITFGDLSEDGDCDDDASMDSGGPCWKKSISNAVVTKPVPEDDDDEDEPSGVVSEEAVLGLAIGGGVLACVGMFAVLVGIRQRNKWRRDKEFIEAGKVAKMDAGLEMPGDTEYDKTARRLQETLAEINRLRAAQSGGGDDSRAKEISELEKQTGELQLQIARMKKAKQEDESLMNRMSRRLLPQRTGGNNTRRQFGATVVSTTPNG